MNSIKILKAFAFGLILSTLSCNTTNQRQASEENVTIAAVRLARLGMNMQDVIARVGMPLPTDSPVLVYPAKEGGFYVFYFIPTSELDSQGPNQGVPTLIAVAKCDKHPVGKVAHGVYLLPKEVEGRRCTGVRLPKE